MDGSELEGRIKNFDRFARDPRSRRHRSHDLQARDRRHQDAASRSPTTSRTSRPACLHRAALPPRHRHRAWTASASASCRTPPRTATRAATRSATSRSAGAAAAADAARARPRAASPTIGARARATAPRVGAFGRMAEASAGKDSVTGHWEMMGIVLDRPFPTFPHGFSAGVIAEFSRLTGRGVLGNKAASGTADHRRARPRAHAHRRADRLHVGRQRVSDRRARRRSCRSPSCIAPARSPTSWSAKGWASAASSRGRSSARRARSSAPSNRHDYALPPSGETLLDRVNGGGVPVVAIGKIEDLFAGRGITPRASTPSATTTAWTRSSAQMARRRSRA